MTIFSVPGGTVEFGGGLCGVIEGHRIDTFRGEVGSSGGGRGNTMGQWGDSVDRPCMGGGQQQNTMQRRETHRKLSSPYGP